MDQRKKNRILIAITKVAAVVMALSVCCVDSVSVVPMITLFLSLVWIALFMAANGDNAEVLFKKWR